MCYTVRAVGNVFDLTCNLSYEYNTEDSSKVEYVTYSYNSVTQKFGVTKDGLNFSRPAIKLSDKVASDGISISWKKVSKKTDLSYVQTVFANLAPYVESTEPIE